MNLLRYIILSIVFLCADASAIFCADAVYVDDERIKDYIEDASQKYKSGGYKINADITEKADGIDNFIQENIILWDTLAIDERKKRIKDFGSMLKDFYMNYNNEKSPLYAKETGMKEEFLKKVSEIIRGVMARKKTHVMFEADKKEDMPSDAVDITDDVLAELKNYEEYLKDADAQKAASAKTILYKIGYIKDKDVNLKAVAKANEGRIIAILESEYVIILPSDSADWIKIMTSRGIGYVKPWRVEIKELHGKIKE